MTPGQLLEIAALLVTAALALWLGLTVATRTSTPVGRLFAVLAITIAAWSTSLLVERLSDAPRAISAGHAFGELTSALAIAATAHLALLIASEGHPPRRRVAVVAAGYVVIVGLSLPSFLDPAVSPAAMAKGPLPGSIFGWSWILARLVALALATFWLLDATRAADRRSQRRRQLRAALATVLIGTVGAGLRFLPVVGDADAWIGVSLVAVAIVLAAYAVFAAAIFFDSTVASRAFWTSLLAGIGLAAVLGLTLVLDAAGRSLAGLDVPLFTGLALIVAVAVYEPLAARIRAITANGPRDVARQRLLQALGQSTLATQSAGSGVMPALEQLAETLGVPGIQVIGPGGDPLASTGAPGLPVRREPLFVSGEHLGELVIGEPRPARPWAQADDDLVQRTGAFVATALRAGRNEEAHIESLAGLSQQRADVEQQATALHAAMVQHGRREDGPGLVVFALGPLRVERQGRQVERWGGDKAGSRQAEGLFAFLLDRGERGFAKDEVLELIWPDTDLEKADLAFHRTMVGLRQTLDPARTRGDGSAIRFRNDRYRLSPEAIAWSDTAEFLARLEAASAAEEPRARRRMLEEARTLYRGDYLDDCPFYGDSAYVEERRGLLRHRAQDLLIALGEAYEAEGDRVSAGAAFREAIARAVDPCAPAEAGLARLGF